MDKIDTFFTKCVRESSNVNPAIRAATIHAKATLNKYYELMDHSEVYRISMSMIIIFFFYLFKLTSLALVLHPKYKLRYFRKAGWDEAWITTSRQLVEDEFDRYYKNRPVAKESRDSDDSSDSDSEQAEQLKKTMKVGNFFLFEMIFADTHLEQ